MLGIEFEGVGVIRRGTAAAWKAANFVLDDGQWAEETDSKRKKFGDGVTPWNSLPYADNNDAVRASAGAVGLDQIIGTGWYASSQGIASANQNFQKVVPLPFGGSDISFEFENTNGNGEVTALGLTFGVSVSLTPNGTPIPITINGAATYTFIAGTKGRVRTDPLLGYNFLPGNIYVTIYADPTGTGSLPTGMPCQAANGDRWNYSASHGETNQTLNGAYNYTGQANAQVYLYGFSAVFGKLGKRIPSVASITDSIGAGVGENAALPGLGWIGWLNRAFNGVLPTAILGQTGETALITNAPASANIRRAITNKGAKFINELVINDVIGNQSLATVQTRVISNAVSAWIAGAQVWQVTPTPYTSGTWTTIDGQTLSAFETVRADFSAWIKDGAPLTVVNNVYTAALTGSTAAGVIRMGNALHPMFSYIDVEAICIDPATRKWKAGATLDGTHPVSTYHALIAASVTPANYPALFVI